MQGGKAAVSRPIYKKCANCVPIKCEMSSVPEADVREFHGIVTGLEDRGQIGTSLLGIDIF
jgi:hypothetical protein